MKCTKAKSLLSQHLDGELSRVHTSQMEEHLSACVTCHSDYVSLRETSSLLSGVGRKKAPADLTLRLRLAMSREAAQKQVTLFEKLRFRLEHVFEPFMVPATAGLLSAVVFFGLLIGFFTVPSNKNDVPVSTVFYTPPELAISPFGLSENVSSDSFVIEAYIDANGRVQDYRVLSSPDGKVTDVDPRIKNMLIFTVFRPATSYGRPTTGKAVLSFSEINVKG
jgi:Putative zinc-finger